MVGVGGGPLFNLIIIALAQEVRLQFSRPNEKNRTKEGHRPVKLSPRKEECWAPSMLYAFYNNRVILEVRTRTWQYVRHVQNILTGLGPEETLTQLAAYTHAGLYSNLDQS